MTALHPIAPELSPLQQGERVAFRETHPKHPGMYGSVQTVGVDATGRLAFDLLVYDPADGSSDGTIYRSTLEDIQ